MQGNLNEIDIRSVLQLIELGQQTGELCPGVALTITIELAMPAVKATPTQLQIPQEQYWFVFFLNGQIVYVVDSDSSLSVDHLRRYRVDESR